MESLLTVDSKFWSKGRLQTFDKWPFNSEDPCNPQAMAAAGFFAVGGSDEPDLAECIFCSKQLDGWEPTDDPWQEHKSHQANCPFVKLNKISERDWTIEETFALFTAYCRNQCDQKVKSIRQNLEREVRAQSAEIPKILQKARKHKRSK